MAAHLDRASPVPLWAQLLDDLRQRLGAGEFDRGFPTEMALVARYQVSRNTVREALRRLRAEGTVIAERGRRPRLAGATEIMQPLGALYSLFSSVQAAGMRQSNIVRALDVRQAPEVAEHLGLSGDTDLLYLERVRLAEGDPLAIDKVWFPAELAQPLLDADLSTSGFYDELAERTGIRLTGGHEQIRAAVPTSAERATLGLGPEVAVFEIERLGLVNDQPVEWRHTIVRGDRFSVVAEFSGGAGYRLSSTRPSDPGEPGS